MSNPFETALARNENKLARVAAAERDRAIGVARDLSEKAARLASELMNNPGASISLDYLEMELRALREIAARVKEIKGAEMLLRDIANEAACKTEGR